MSGGKTKGQKRKQQQAKAAKRLAKATNSDPKEMLDTSDRRGLPGNRKNVHEGATPPPEVLEASAGTPVNEGEQQAVNVGQTPPPGAPKDAKDMTDEEIENAITQNVGALDAQAEKDARDNKAKLKGKEKEDEKKAKDEKSDTKISGKDIIDYIYEEYWLAFLGWSCDQFNKRVMGIAGILADKAEGGYNYLKNVHQQKEEGRRLDLLGKKLRECEANLVNGARHDHNVADMALDIAGKMAANGGKFPKEELDALESQRFRKDPDGLEVERPEIASRINLINRLQQKPEEIATLPALANSRVDTTALVSAMRGEMAPDQATQIVDAAKRANDAAFQTSQKLAHAATELTLADFSQHLDLIDRSLSNRKNFANLILNGIDKDGNPALDASGKPIPSFTSNLQALQDRIKIDDSVHVTGEHIQAVDNYLDEVGNRAEAVNKGNKEEMEENKTIEGYKEGNVQELEEIHALKPNFPQAEHQNENENDSHSDDGHGNDGNGGNGGNDSNGGNGGNNGNSGAGGNNSGGGETTGSGSGETGAGEVGSNENIEQEPVTHKDLSKLALGTNENNVVMLMTNKMKNPDLDDQTRDMMGKIKEAYNSHNPEEIAKLNDSINTKEDAEIANNIASIVEGKSGVKIPEAPKKEQEEGEKDKKEKDGKDPSAKPAKSFDEQKQERLMALAGDYAKAMGRGDKAEAERIQGLMAEEATRRSPEEIAADEKRKKANEDFYKKAEELSKGISDAEASLKKLDKNDKNIQGKLDKMQSEADKRHSKETADGLGIETPEKPDKPGKPKKGDMKDLAEEDIKSGQKIDNISKESASVDMQLENNGRKKKQNEARKQKYLERVGKNGKNKDNGGKNKGNGNKVKPNVSRQSNQGKD